MKGLLLAALLSSTPAAATPELRPERVVLKTDAGDLVLALYAGAPRHAAKLLALFRSGAYETVPVTRIDPSRFIAFGSLQRRRQPLPEAVLRPITRLAVENDGPHRAGVIAMAHQPDDADPGETAFIVLLADIPAMDGRFSAVGELAGGDAVLRALTRAATDADGHPVRPLEVRSTAVLDSASALEATALRGPDSAALGQQDAASRRRILFLVAALGFILAAALARSRRRLGAAAPSLSLLALLAGFFAVFAALTDRAATTPGLGVALFAATVGIFRLMGRFER